MDHLVTPAQQAEASAILARLLDNPRSIEALAGALRQLASALDAVAASAWPAPPRHPSGWQQP